MTRNPGSWWLVPAALVALVVLLEGARQEPRQPDLAARAEAAVLRPGGAVLQDATGHRLRPPAGGILVLDFGPAVPAQRLSLRLWQLDAAGARRQPAWLQATPKPRADGTLPVAGVPQGSYDVEVEFAAADGAPRCGRADGVALAAGATQQVVVRWSPAAAPGR